MHESKKRALEGLQILLRIDDKVMEKLNIENESKWSTLPLPGDFGKNNAFCNRLDHLT